MDHATDASLGPALASAVREVERHASAAGWDRPPALYALVRTTELVRDEPEVAGRLALDAATAGVLTPVAQEDLVLDGPVAAMLAGIDWPDPVVGAVLVLETVAVPDDVEDEAPEADAAAWAARHPRRQEARIVVGVLRTGSRAAALRWRGHDADEDVVTGPDLAPALTDALGRTLR